jgi:hypothetical protein
MQYTVVPGGHNRLSALIASFRSSSLTFRFFVMIGLPVSVSVLIVCLTETVTWG